MKNLVQHGHSLPLIAPEGGVTSGLPVAIGSLFGVAAFTAAAGALFELVRGGVFSDLPKTSSEIWAVGDTIYFDPATSKLTKVAGSLKPVGIAVAAAVSAATVGTIVLVPNV